MTMKKRFQNVMIICAAMFFLLLAGGAKNEDKHFGQFLKKYNMEFGDSFTKVDNIVNSLGWIPLQKDKRARQKWQWLSLKKPKRKKDGKLSGLAVDRDQTNRNKTGFDSAQEGYDLLDKPKQQRIAVYVRFFAKSEEGRVKKIFVFDKKKPQEIYHNYLVYYFHFTSEDKLYQVTIDMAKMELPDNEHNYVLEDLKTKYNLPYRTFSNEAMSGKKQYITKRHVWKSPDSKRRIEARIVTIQHPSQLQIHQPVYVRYSDIAVGEEYLNKANYLYKKTKELIERLNL